MYYLHIVNLGLGNIYAVLTKGIARQGAIVNATHAYGPYATAAEANDVANYHNAKVI